MLTPEIERYCPETALAERLLGCAEFCGYQSDFKGGEFQLWSLTKTLNAKLVKGTTVTRETLRAHFFPNP